MKEKFCLANATAGDLVKIRRDNNGDVGYGVIMQMGNRTKAIYFPSSSKTKKERGTWIGEESDSYLNDKKIEVRRAESLSPVNLIDETEKCFERSIERIFPTPPLSVSVQLNEAYRAEVSAEGIKVGCQTFSLDVVGHLVSAIKTIRENS